MTMKELKAGQDDAGRRLDRILFRILPHLPRGRIFQALRKKDIRLNGTKAGPASRVQPGDTITLAPFLLPPRETPASQPAPKTGTGSAHNYFSPPIPCLYRSEDLIIISKPAGRLVQGEGGLDREIQDRWRENPKESSLSFRPGPLHRLDRNTSGILVFSLSLQGAQAFSRALQEHQLEKSYLGLSEGTVPPAALGREELWSDDLLRDPETRRSRTAERDGPAAETFPNGTGDKAGRKAVTRAVPLLTSPQRTLFLFQLETGRTHQIRAQAAARGFPLAGDRKYGSPSPGPWLLHACRLAARTEPPLFPPIQAPPPEAMIRVLQEIFPPATVKKTVEKALKGEHTIP